MSQQSFASQSVSVKDEARILIDSLPDNATWEDLAHEMNRRLAASSVRPAPTEAELLTRINEGPDEAFWKQYRALIALRREYKLTLKQQQQLIDMADTVEAYSAGRLLWLTQLAERRGVTVKLIMHELGLHPMNTE